MNKRLLITLGIALFLIGGTLAAIRFAQGYRLDFKKKKVTSTGLLVANSYPKGASVYINDNLTTATDDTLNLPPGEYQVKIIKDGYLSWEKTLKLEKEVVTQANARLFPAVPDLKGLTYSGALNLTPSPDGQKIAFSVASASGRLKNGLWVLNMNSSAFASEYELLQISQNSSIFDFTDAKLCWSPDGRQILAKNEADAVLLDNNRLNKATDFKDVTAQLPLILTEWEEELELKRQRQWKKLPEAMQKIASDSAKLVYFSPDEEKVLYTAINPATIPEELVPSLPGSNTQTEEREIKANRVYVYDLKEDKNFFIIDAKPASRPASPNRGEQAGTAKEEEVLEKRMEAIQNQYSPLKIQGIQWFPTSNHLIYTNSDKVIIMEYDGTNRTTVYAGPFEDSFAYPWPDASKMLILTNLNPDTKLPSNLYAVELK